jgi:hypothetical protein
VAVDIDVDLSQTTSPVSAPLPQEIQGGKTSLGLTREQPQTKRGGSRTSTASARGGKQKGVASGRVMKSTASTPTKARLRQVQTARRGKPFDYASAVANRGNRHQSSGSSSPTRTAYAAVRGGRSPSPVRTGYAAFSGGRSPSPIRTGYAAVGRGRSSGPVRTGYAVVDSDDDDDLPPAYDSPQLQTLIIKSSSGRSKTRISNTDHRHLSCVSGLWLWSRRLRLRPPRRPINPRALGFAVHSRQDRMRFSRRGCRRCA